MTGLTGFLIFLTAVAGLLLGYAFWPARQTARLVPQRPQGAARGPLRGAEDVLDQSEENVLIAAYPGIHEIRRLPLAPLRAPKLVEDLSADAVAAIQDRVAGIKPIPVNHLRLMRLLGNPQSAPAEINALATTNPVLSARILRTVNSPYFGRSQKITSVGRAITLLGYNNVRILVLRESLNAVMPAGDQGLVERFNKIWMHSAAVSACAAHLGRSLFQFPDYELGTIGRLHDIGKYFVHLLAEPTQATGALPRVLQEDFDHGLNHATLGGLIAARWQLSDNVAKTIEYHHHPLFCLPEAIPAAWLKHSFVVCLSDLICRSIGYSAEGDDGDLWKVRPEYFELFKLNPDLHGVVTVRLVQEIENANATVQSYVTEA
jgi:HD-like signal output (HDOD) protein